MWASRTLGNLALQVDAPSKPTSWLWRAWSLFEALLGSAPSGAVTLTARCLLFMKAASRTQGAQKKEQRRVQGFQLAVGASIITNTMVSYW